MPDGDYWTDQETRKLLSLVSEHGTDWDLIARRLRGRTVNAVRVKYYRLISPTKKAEESSSSSDDDNSSPAPSAFFDRRSDYLRKPLNLFGGSFGYAPAPQAQNPLSVAQAQQAQYPWTPHQLPPLQSQPPLQPPLQHPPQPPATPAPPAVCPHASKTFAQSRFASLSPPSAPTTPTSPLPIKEAFPSNASVFWSAWHLLIPSAPNGKGWFSSTGSDLTVLSDILSSSIIGDHVYGTYELALGTSMVTVYVGCSQHEEDGLRDIFRRFYLHGAHLRDLLLPYLQLGSTVSVRWVKRDGSPTIAVAAAKTYLAERLLSFDYAFKDAPLASRHPLLSNKQYLLDHLLTLRHKALSPAEKHICELIGDLSLTDQSSLLSLLHQHGAKKQAILIAEPNAPPEADFVFPPPPPLKPP